MWYKPMDESSLVLLYVVIYCVFELWGACVLKRCDMNDKAHAPFLFFNFMQLFYLFMIQREKSGNLKLC